MGNLVLASEMVLVSVDLQGSLLGVRLKGEESLSGFVLKEGVDLKGIGVELEPNQPNQNWVELYGDLMMSLQSLLTV